MIFFRPSTPSFPFSLYFISVSFESHSKSPILLYLHFSYKFQGRLPSPKSATVPLSRKKRIISIFLKPLNLLSIRKSGFFLLSAWSFRCRYLLKQIITSIWTDTVATRQSTGNKKRPGSWTDSLRTVQRLIEEGQCRSEQDKWEGWQGSNISPCRNYSFSPGQTLRCY